MTRCRIDGRAPLALLCLLLLVPAQAWAQRGPAPAAPPGVAIHAFGDLGMTVFSAADSFKAVLGSATGVVFGGGVEADVTHGLFVSARASRFRKTGERAFVYEGDVYPLGVDSTVTVTPLEFSGGYRFLTSSRVTPYAGGGVGWHRYEERSPLATDEENLTHWVTGYQILGGAEVRVSPWVAIAGEAQWTRVPDGLGQELDSVSAAFDQHDLGGATFRVKLVVGR